MGRAKEKKSTKELSNALKSIEERAREEIMDLVDKYTALDVMKDWHDAFNFLTDLSEEIHDRAEVLQEENE